MKDFSFNRILMFLFSLYAMLALSACGGGGGGNTAAPSAGGAGGTVLTSITGVVIDDYLDGVTVCLDTNNNSVCDTGEPTSITMNGGRYTFNNVAAADVNATLLAFVPTTANSISATTGAATVFGKTVAFSTPGGQKAANGDQNITPFTTMIKRIQDSTGASATAATAQMKQKLGLTGNAVDLFGDYTAGTIANDPYTAKLLKVAQATTIAIADNYTAITTAIVGNAALAGTSLDQIVAVIVDQVLANLGAVTLAVDTYTVNGTFNAASAASAVPAVDVAAANLQNQFAAVAAQQQANNATALAPSTLKQLLTTTGLNSIWGWWNGSNQVDVWVDKITIDPATGKSITSSWTNTLFQNNNYTGWQANNYTGWIKLSAAQQQQQAYTMFLDAITGAITIKNSNIDEYTAFNLDGTTTSTFGPARRTTTVSGIDVYGLPIRGFVNLQQHGDGWLQPLPANASFGSPSAQAWRLTHTTQTDVYSIWMDNTPATCQQNGVTPYIAGVTNCNGLPAFDAYGNLIPSAIVGSTASTPAKTLADVIVVDPYAGLLDLYSISQVDPYGFKAFNLLATSKTATTGTYRYWDWNTGQYVGVATWQYTRIGGTQVITWNDPAVWIALGYWGSDTVEFNVVHSGYVYWGSYAPAGTIMTDTFFNDAALQDLKTAVGAPSAIGLP